MNNLIFEKNYFSVEGLDKALEIAKVLINADYQVFVQNDDCDIYIVAYAYNDLGMGSDRFALISYEEEEEIERLRDDAENTKAIERVKDLIRYGELNGDKFVTSDEKSELIATLRKKSELIAADDDEDLPF